MGEPVTATGKVWIPEIYPDGPQAVLYPQAGAPLLDPAHAAAVPLAAFLGNLDFCRWGGNAPNTPFKLNKVFHEWPEPDLDLPYPCATVTEVSRADISGHNFVPTALESTFGQYCPDTVLWKLGEVQIEFQVDFWTTDIPTREALGARLPSAFAPGESSSCIVLCGDCRYWDRPVRCTLVGYERRDDSDTVFVRERRLIATIRCDIDVVDLRCANLLQASERYDIGENVATPPAPEASPVPPCKDE